MTKYGNIYSRSQLTKVKTAKRRKYHKGRIEMMDVKQADGSVWKVRVPAAGPVTIRKIEPEPTNT
jgi:hypothetical protein